MSHYYNLPLIGPFLRSHDVDTQAKLFSLDVLSLASMEGFGIKKIQALLDLVKSERNRIPAIPTPTKEIDLQVYANMPISKSLGRLPLRIQAKIEKYDLRTVQDLYDWSNKVDVKREDNYGYKSQELLVSKLRELSEKGPLNLVFGTEVEPNTADALASAYMKVIDERARGFVDSLYFKRLTLQEIGAAENPPITRERVRQVISRGIEADRGGWQDTAQDILHPLKSLLETGNGVTFLDRALSSVGASSLGTLELVADIANIQVYAPSGGSLNVLTEVNSEGFRSWLSEFNENVLNVIGDGCALSEVVASLSNDGYDFPESDIVTLVTSLCNVIIKNDHVYSSRRAANLVYIETLRNSSIPLTSQEVAEITKVTNPEIPSSARNAATHFARAKTVFKIDEGKYIHKDGLPISLDELNEIAKEALKLIPKNGQAVSVKRIQKEMASLNRNVKSLSPYTIRDSLLNTGKVRSWRAGCDVAWICENTYRTSIIELIKEIAPTMNAPFTMKELVEAVSTFGGFEESSVTLQAISCEDILLLGADKHITKSHVFKTDQEFYDYREKIVLAMSYEDITSANKVYQALKSNDKYSKKWGPGIIFAVARTSDLVSNRIKGQLLWRKELGDNSWEATIRSASFKPGVVFTPSELQKWYESHLKVTNSQMAYATIKDAKKMGTIIQRAQGCYSIP